MTELPRAAQAPAVAQPATPWAALAGVIAAVSVFAIAQGLSYPLLSFILERHGASASMIGVSAAMTPLGFILGSPMIPLLARSFGPGPVALLCAISGALLLALIGWTQDFWAWLPLRFLLGLAVGPLYVVSEVWIIGLAPPHRRGRILGIYTTVISTGFAAGPVALILVGSHGWPPFLVGIAAFLGCAICLVATLPRLPGLDGPGEKASVRTFLPHAPTLLIAVFVTAAFEQALFSLLPVYGLSHGIGEARMAALLVAVVVGNIALQIPLGFAAERFGAAPMLVACALATLLGCILLPFLIVTPLIWPLAVIWGATSFGIYTLALIELGARFTGPMLVAGNAAFAMVWGVAGMAGPSGTGLAMDLIGVQGFPLVLGAMCLALVLVKLSRRSAPRSP
ncbi:MAG TPA: MFS transporter [Propylenella sp.]|nr:MFS transporter [Propylenella sp.]